jgi:hypothetical protein
MLQPTPIESMRQRKERYEDVKQIELATLVVVYKKLWLLSLASLSGLTLCLLYNAGWRANQYEQLQQEHQQLRHNANQALWEIENGSQIEAANKLREAL